MSWMGASAAIHLGLPSHSRSSKSLPRGTGNHDAPLWKLGRALMAGRAERRLNPSCVHLGLSSHLSRFKDLAPCTAAHFNKCTICQCLLLLGATSDLHFPLAIMLKHARRNREQAKKHIYAHTGSHLLIAVQGSFLIVQKSSWNVWNIYQSSVYTNININLNINTNMYYYYYCCCCC